MRKALVLMMTTCILLAGCIEGLTGDVEEVVEELAPGCNDPTAINYDENDTTATTCITEDVLFESIGEFTEKNGNNTIDAVDAGVSKGVSMTISGVDEEMGMGAYTMVSKTAANENTAYSGTDITVSGMTISQSWTIQESGDGTILQASYMGESFLMHSAMSWDDVSDDCDDSDGRDCVDAEISQEDCERRGGTWIEVTNRPIEGYCNFEDDGDRGDDDSDNTQENCEQRGGTWTQDESGDYNCEFDDDGDESDRDDDDSEVTQEDCEERGGTWTQDETEDYHCEFDDEDRDDSDRDDERDDSDGDMDMDIPDPMDFLSMLDGVDDDCDGAADSANPGACGFPENTAFEVGVDGITVTIPTEEGQSMEMMFDLVTGEMTGLSMDMDDGSHMKLEMLTTEEANALLTIDTTLEYEALPFTLEEADAEDDDDAFICDNGQEIPADWENDGFADCSDGSDENIHDWTDYDGGYCEWISEDTWWQCKYSEEDEDWDIMWYYCENHDVDWHCTDDKGQSADYEHSADGTEWSEPEIFVCDNGDEILASMVNDGWDDCGDGSDEGVEEQEEGPLNRTFTVTSDADFDFAGSFDDYSIVLANCVEETDDMGETTLTCDEDNSTMYSLGEPEAHDDTTAAVYLSYGDSDSSGTLTNGDTIMIDGNTSVDWTHLRLHSTSADAYSDENPLQELPGFTALLSVLSLIGAAMIGRRD